MIPKARSLRSRATMAAAVAALLLFTVTPVFAAFSKVGAFTVQASQMGQSETNFSFLIYWTDATLKQTGSGGSATDAQGDDIRPFSASNCTGALTYQRFFYEGTVNGTIGMYVKDTGGVGHSIYLCVGDATITTDGSSTGAWDGNTVLAMPFPDGTNLDTMDWGPLNNDGTNTGNTAGTGKIDGGGVSDGTATNRIVLVSRSIASGDFTIRGWINSSSFAAIQVLYSQGRLGNDGGYIYLGTDASSHITASIDHINGDSGSSTLSTGTWYLIGMTYSSSTITFYLNGVSDGTASRTADYTSTDASVANYVSASGSWVFPIVGSFDDVRIDSTARSSAWMLSEFKNQNSQATFWGTVTFNNVASGTRQPCCLLGVF